MILAALQVNVPRTIGILRDAKEIVISRNPYASKRQILKQYFSTIKAKVLS